MIKPILIAFSAALAFSLILPAYADGNDIHRDNMRIRRENHDIRHDRQALHRAERNGNVRAANRDRRDLHRDRVQRRRARHDRNNDVRRMRERQENR